MRTLSRKYGRTGTQPASAIDRLTVRNTRNYVDNPEATLREYRRVLRT
jgi:ubiquinone/menaquinone biosynthesis C-methylase UbiE